MNLETTTETTNLDKKIQNCQKNSYENKGNNHNNDSKSPIDGVYALIWEGYN